MNYPIGNTSAMPDIPAVYIVWEGDVPLYVGASKHVKTRWIYHDRKDQIRDNHPDAIIELAVINVAPPELFEIEQRFIDNLNPLYNNTPIIGLKYKAIFLDHRTHHRIKMLAAKRRQKMYEVVDDLAREEARKLGVDIRKIR